MAPSETAVVIGAGPAGLACAASLLRAGFPVTVLEKTDEIGTVWRQHYDRLHLHTDRSHSGLPGWPMPRAYPRYPSRQQVVDYLEAYAEKFDIRPVFKSRVNSISRENGAWRVEAEDKVRYSRCVIVATGLAGAPYRPAWPGMETFSGDILHSSEYRNPGPYGGRRVLVVGFGNSGGEIALDLAEAGVSCTMAVRSPVQVLPRDLLGLPILTWSILEQPLPTRLADYLNAPIVRLAVGSLRRLGLEKAAKGPLTMIKEDGRIPLLDIGTIAKIRERKIAIRPGIQSYDGDSVVFEDGVRAQFDSVILATGFRPDLRPLLPGVEGVLDETGLPLVSGRPSGQPGLFFCSYFVSPTGQLREIGIEAKRITESVKSLLAATA